MEETFLLWGYITTCTLLLLHQIDAAFWEEWKLFSLPGGKSTFLFLHLFIIPLIIYGVVLIKDGVFSEYVFFASAFLGLLTLVIHGFFFACGYEQFKKNDSLIIFFLLGISSFSQLIFLFLKSY